jgi:hypothetical protein
MTSETCETITQTILNNQNSSSSSSSSPSLQSSLPQENNRLLGIATEFVDSKKITSHFQIPMHERPEFSSTSISNFESATSTIEITTNSELKSESQSKNASTAYTESGTIKKKKESFDVPNLSMLYRRNCTSKARY